jgi:hypothetical protein
LARVDLAALDSVGVGIETNGKGFIGFLVELPGAFVRGRTEAEALSKVPKEARSYLEWLGVPMASKIEGHVVETHHCQLTVEDADGEILLKADTGPLSQDEFARLVAIGRRSGQTFGSLYDSCELKDWADSSRARKTFYGDAPKTIREIVGHVQGTQHYYLSRIGLSVARQGSLMDIRESGLQEIGRLFEKEENSRVYDVDQELWTLKKVLRRFIWHDRIHGKAITRILAEQKRLGLIKDYEDMFRFHL